MIKLNTPLSIKDLNNLTSGDQVLISGIIYTARDAAHKKLIEEIKNNNKLPFNPESNIIYYVGPTPAKPGEVIGSAGPTSSYRMDPYSKILMEYGLNVMIGKGPRGDSFKSEMIELNGIYLSAIGGAAALISQSIKEARVICYDDLGPEAIYRLIVKDFPAIVTYDLKGNDLFNDGINKYKSK